MGAEKNPSDGNTLVTEVNRMPASIEPPRIIQETPQTFMTRAAGGGHPTDLTDTITALNGEIELLATAESQHDQGPCILGTSA